MGSSDAPTVFLHIGTPKSGTTYLQSRFADNHRRAAAQGLLWPGPSWDRHVAAVAELRSLRPGAVPEPGGPWDRLAAEVLGWSGPAALVSMEWFSWLTDEQVRAAVDSLRPARIEVVCTARDLLRNFVAQAQEMSKNYRPWSWERITTEVRGDGGPAHRAFWTQQDVPAILRRWLEHVPADQVHLVTVPPAGAAPEVLWERFCGVVGVDGSRFTEPGQVNASLGVLSTVLMQRLNRVAKSRDLPPEEYDRALRQAVAVEVLAGRRTREDAIAVDAETERFLRERADAMVADLKGLGVVLHGTWDDLVPGAAPSGTVPTDVTDGELLQAALETIVDLAVSGSSEQAEGAPDRRPTEVARRAVRRLRGERRRAKRLG